MNRLVVCKDTVSAFQTRTASLKHWLVAFVSIAADQILQVYNAEVYILPLYFCVLYFVFRSTNKAAGKWEIQSRIKLFANVHNDVRNRSALQSTDVLIFSRNR